MIAWVLLFAGAAFTLSASAGLGGSLILVPAMSLFIGPKEGVALAALLLACNNVLKVGAYRQTLPWRASLRVVILSVVGATLGARLLVASPERLVAAAVIVSVLVTMVTERLSYARVGHGLAPMFAFLSGATSGFSGTSGPLKGLALRSLRLDRRHIVGAASLTSLASDAAKAAVYASAALFTAGDLTLVALALPVMVVGTLTGRRLNARMGERGYTGLFWAVMLAYGVRLAAV